MNHYQAGGAIAALLISWTVMSCNQRTQSLYKIEVERACRNCDLVGINLANQSLSGKYRVSVSNTPLSTNPRGLGYATPVDLTGANLRDAKFTAATLADVIFNDAQLTSADFSDANLRDAQFVRADLTNANLQGADLEGVNFQDAVLRGADLRDCDLSTANLEGADLTDALR
jgi:uncharacterized protein YjbI with pentapeptide repeats